MKNGWPEVPLGQLIRHRKEFIQIDDAMTYRRCRVQLHAQGIVLRDQVSGFEVKTKKQQVCKNGEFLVAEIDAKVGGYGIVPDSLNGSIVSSHYFLFDINTDRLNRAFLGYFIRTPWFAEQVTAQGSTNYAAIRPSHVLAYKIPLPPIDEQRRIVTRIDQLAAKIAEAQSLDIQVMEGIEALSAASAARLFETLCTDHPVLPIDDLIEEAGYGTSVKCNYDRANGEMAVLRIPNIASEIISFEDLKYADLSEAEQERVTAHDGDVLIVRTNGSAELVGRCAVVRNMPAPMAFASYLIRIRFNSKVDSDFVQAMLKHLRINGTLIDFARTTAGQYNVSLGRLRRASIPVPSIIEQRRIVAYLNDLSAKAESLKKLRQSAGAELGALMPSILDRAFQGGI